ncbi:MAG: metallophosphoesterase family protein [Acidobacteriota bacterium]
MRIAALYDIHGNLPALEAVLAEVRRAGAEQIVFGGDFVPGPDPRGVLERLASLEVPWRAIQGNGEAAVLASRAGRPLDGRLPPPVQELIHWSAAELTADQAALLASWPMTLELAAAPFGEILFCHGTPQDENQIFTRRTSEARLLPLFEAVAAPLVVCGHTHMQFDRRIGSHRVVNAGSVGMPFGAPGAYWLLLDGEVALQRTGYDLAAAAATIAATAYPQADEFSQWVLSPRPEAEVLTQFSQVELR